MADHDGDAREAIKSTREARANAYFEQDLKGQRQWYGERARISRQRAQQLSFLLIAAGAAVSVIQVLPPALWVTITTAALGALVTLTEGWQRIARYGETWMAYRIASERMKREWRLYVNGASAYRGLDEEPAFLQFVEAIEGVLAEEQQIYWRSRAASAREGEPKSAGTA